MIRARLRSKGHSYTAGRRAVLRAIGEMDHPTADEVFNAAKRKHLSIALGTVYAALATLEVVGLIEVRRWAHSPARYDGNMESHVDVRCEKCGAVEEIPDGGLERAEKRLRKSSTYDIIGTALMVEGVCPACRAAGRGAA